MTRASHVSALTFALALLLAGSAWGQPVINEFMASNDSVLADEDGDYSDWIEIYNPTGSTISLAGWYLTDEEDNLNKWQFPAVSIPASGYLVVFASGKDRAVVGSELHTDFKLSASGEYLALVGPDGVTVVQEFAPEYPAQVEDVSNGLGLAAAMTETLVASNATAYAKVPTDASEETSWMANGYDHSGWASGPLGVGYDEADTYIPYIGLDVKTEMNEINPSVYIRIPFTVDNAAAVQSMTLRMRYDDGFLAYINGQMVATQNAPTGPPLAWNVGATTIHSDTSAVQFLDYDVTSGKTSLVDGVNTLAIHGLNRSSTSSDFLIGPELNGTIAATGAEAELRYFTTATPGVANATGILGYVEEVQFSIDRGFYDGPFALMLWTDTPDATIRYTLDGSEPTASHGTIYTGSIVVTTNTVVRAMAYKSGYVAAPPVSHTYIFLADVLTQSNTQTSRDFPNTWYAGASSSGAYDRRTRPGDYAMDPYVVNDPDYSGQMITALTSIPTVALTFNTHDLWDSSDGMYPNSIMRASTNIFWEKPASMELIDPAGGEEFCINAGARISGELARWPAVNDKQSIRVVFRGEYGATKLETNFFGDPDVDEYDTILLRANWGDGWLRDAQRGIDLGISWLDETGDDSTYLRDQYVHDAFRATGNVGIRGRYVHLYLNGVYWGLYCAIERPDNGFAAEHFGGPKDDWNVIKGTLADTTRNGTLKDGNKDAWNKLFTWFDASSTGTNYTGQVGTITDAELALIEEYLDVDQFIDYMITLWTYNRLDFPRKNWYAVGKGGSSTTPPEVPFRFFTWDSEASTGQPDPEGREPDCTSTADRWNGTDDSNDTGPVRLYRRLITNASFRQRWADHAQELMLNDGPLSPQASADRYIARCAEIDTAIIAESARWGDSKYEWGGNSVSVQTRNDRWIPERDRMISQYFPARTGYAIDQMRSYDLFPSIDPPTFSQHGGEYAPGYQLTITNPNGTGMVCYTLDGSDPRTSGTGAMFSAPIALTGSLYVKAAVLVGGTWSTVTSAGFMPEGGPEIEVSEIMYNPPAAQPGETYASEEYEFIEIRNVGAEPISLNAIAFSEGVQFEFGQGLISVIGPGQNVVVAKNTSAFTQRYPTAGVATGTYVGLLDNDGETLTMTAAGIPFLSFAYNDADNWPGRADGRGASLERVDFEIDPASDDAWASSAEYGGSPNADGAGQIVDIVINEVMTHTDLPATDWIELHNVTGSAIDVSGWYLSDSWVDYKKFAIPNGTIIPAGGYVVFDETDFNVTGLNTDPGDDDPKDFGLDGAHGDDVWLMAADGSDKLTRFVDHVEFGAAFNSESFGRWPNATGDLYPMVSPTHSAANSGPKPAPVRISEVMYNPGGPEFDDLEFVEIYNASGSDVDLTGWRLRKGVDYDFDDAFVLLNGERLVVLSYNPDKPENIDRVTDFRTTYGIDDEVLLVGGWDGKLDDAGESIQLQQPDTPPADEPYYTPSVVVDEVVYDDIAPWPTSPDGLGDSLHRAGGSSWGNDPASWTAGVPSPGTGVDLKPGDANMDGVVDLYDFVILKTNFGRTDATWTEADFDGDNDVDLNDFVILKTNFGT